MRKNLLSISIMIILLSCNSVDKLIKKGDRYYASLKMDKAIECYKKAIEIDKNNYKANATLGVLLSEYMKLPEQALPYLEAAYLHSPKDTSIDVVYALAKSYQYAGEYEKSLNLLKRLHNVQAVEDDDVEFQKDVKKRIEDCEYAIIHKNDINENIKVINLGKKINTSAPEYVPAMIHTNELYFTSRRKDSPKEKLFDEDGKYYEAMYASKISNGSPSAAEYLYIPQISKKMKANKNRSIISISGNKKYLFVFEDNQITQVPIDSIQTKKNKPLSKVINFSYYQNHAFLSKDEKTLLFTSDAENGLGGLDIYISRKNADGNWSSPENIGVPINTEYDEDAPFLTDDGKTLYFFSNGHKGFGNYDIYKSEYINGKWTEPVNLGKPINSSGDDIFYIEDENQQNVYFSSYRVGGYGDMDIYKIVYLDKFKTLPPTSQHLFSIQTQKINDTTFSLSVNDYPSIQLYYPEWQYNQQSDKNKTTSLYVPINQSVSITYTALAICDTCFEPQKISIQKVIHNIPEAIVSTTNNNNNKPDIKSIPSGLVSYDILIALGYDTTSVYFDFYEQTIKDEYITKLEKNAQILKAHNLAVKIYGYADMYGSDILNLNLSKQRAQAVANFYKNKKVKVLQVVGKGAPKYCNEKNLEKCPDGIHAKHRKARIEVHKLSAE